jgi:hypothetical protein
MSAACFLAVLMASVCPLGAQQGVLHEGRPALRYETSRGATAYVYQVDFKGEPALRFSVIHVHRGDCAGYLYVTRTRIAYDPVFSPDYRQDGFNHPRGELHEAGVAGQGYIKIYTSYRKFNFYALYDRGSKRELRYGKSVRPLMTLVQGAFSDFDGTVQHFKRETAGLQAPAAPAVATQAPAARSSSGPKVRIMEPAVTDPTQPVEVSQATVALRGAALDTKGVLSVTVNGRDAELRSAGDIRAVEFSLKDLAVREGLNRVAVVATNVDRQTTQLEILLWGHLPSAPPAPAVPVTPTPAPAQVTATTSIPMPPAVAATPPAPAADSDTVPLHKDEILQMLQSGLPSDQVADMVEESGIDFEPTEDYYSALRKAGAGEGLINAVRKAKRFKP